MDQQRVNLDGFAIEDPELGLTALRSPHDPEPSLVVADGRVVELDGVPEAEFDSIDTYIARHGLDLTAAQEAMALSDVGFARLLADHANALVGLLPAAPAALEVLAEPWVMTAGVTASRCGPRARGWPTGRSAQCERSGPGGRPGSALPGLVPPRSMTCSR